MSGQQLSAPQAPPLVTIRDVELIKIGSWSGAASGTFNVSADNLYQAVAAMDCPAVRNPVLRLGHNTLTGGTMVGASGESPAVVGEPALGYVTNLRVSMGSTLVGDYCGMPRWFAEIIGSAYPDRSIEGFHPYICQLGHEHPFALTAVALLGVERPAIGTLESLNIRDVAALYDVAMSEGDERSEPITILLGAKNMTAVTAQATVDDVISAFYDLPAMASNYWMWVEQMFIDPAQIIACDDSDGSLWSFSYNVADDGTVTFGEQTQVLRTYITATVAQNKPVVKYASAAESRPEIVVARAKRRDFMASEQTPTEHGKDTVVEDNEMTRLRTLVGVADDADFDTVHAAIQEALTERAEPVAAGANMVTVDAAAFAELQQRAELGRLAHERQQEEDRDYAVRAAIEDGRIAPAARESWLAALRTGPEGARTATLAALNGLPKGTIPVTPVGHAQGASDTASVLEVKPDKRWVVPTGNGR